MVFIIEARATASIIFPFLETIDAALKEWAPSGATGLAPVLAARELLQA